MKAAAAARFAAQHSRGAGVVPASTLPEAEWDRYVRRHPRATVYHLDAWPRIIASTYRFEVVSLGLVGTDGRIRGVLPLLFGSKPLTGRRLVSLPVRGGGVLADTPGDAAALIGAAFALAPSLGATSTAIRTRCPGEEGSVPGLAVRSETPSWRLELPGDPAALEKALRSRSRSLWHEVKRARREGVTVRASRREEDLRPFHRLYLQTMRRLCVPPRSYRALELAWAALAPSGEMRLLLAERDGAPVGGVVLFPFGDTVDAVYLGTADGTKKLKLGHALNWAQLCWSIEHGYRVMDLGLAAPGSGLAEFKRRWGAGAVARYRYVESGGGREGSVKRLHGLRARVASREHGVVSSTWRHMPLALTRLGGALVHRYL